MVEIGPLRRFVAAGAAAQAAVDALGCGVADDRQPLSSSSDADAVTAALRSAVGLLGAIDGLARVADLPVEPAARLLADPAERLRRDLKRVGVIA